MCRDDWKTQAHECRRVDDNCMASFSSIGSIQSGNDCDYVRTTRAFTIIALCLTALSFVWAWLGYNSFDDIMYRFPAMLLSLLAMACGLIGWAVWLAMARGYSADWSYGWSMGLVLGAWLLNLAAAVTMMIPS